MKNRWSKKAQVSAWQSQLLLQALHNLIDVTFVPENHEKLFFELVNQVECEVVKARNDNII